jgi:hypothetical protein
MRAVKLGAVAVILGLLTAGGAAAAVERPNFVGGEILGRGYVLTGNYERLLTPNFGLGVGIMGLGASSDDSGGGILIMPLYASFITGGTHSLYLSSGVTVLSGGGVSDMASSPFNASIGYQYHSRGGFFVRPLFTLFRFTNDDGETLNLIWPGVTLGGSF